MDPQTSAGTVLLGGGLLLTVGVASDCVIAETAVDLLDAVATAIARADGFGNRSELPDLVRFSREKHDRLLELMIAQEPVVGTHIRAIASSTGKAIDELEVLVRRGVRPAASPRRLIAVSSI